MSPPLLLGPRHQGPFVEDSLEVSGLGGFSMPLCSPALEAMDDPEGSDGGMLRARP